MRPDLPPRLAGVLSQHLGRCVDVQGLRRLSGGSSHETWSFELVEKERPAIPLILRREFERGMLDTDVGTEFELLVALRAAGVPVPEPWLCQMKDSALDLPFMVMASAEGMDLRKDLARAARGRDLESVAAQVVELQAAIHAVDVAGLPASGDAVEPEGGAAHELTRWTAVIDTAKVHPDPLLVTALTWLRLHPPGPVRPVLVHGDFKANNLMISSEGRLTVLDWEMAHLGDPIEDLAWTMLWRTEWDVIGGLQTPEAYVAAYVALTGRQVDSPSLRWWRIFSLVKLWAIFATGVTGPSPRPLFRLMGRATVWLADQVAHELLAATDPEASTG